MARRDIEAGRAFVRLTVRRSAFDSGMKAAKAALVGFGQAAAAASAAAVAAGGAITAGITAAVVKFAATGDKLDKMASRTGVSAQALSELGFAAERSGTDLATVEKGVRRMQKTIVDAADGTQEGVDALKRLGVSAADLAGMSPEKQFEVLAQRISEISDPTTQAAAAMEVFGRGGTQLLPLLQGGAAGMSELREEARRLGVTLTDDQAAAGAAVTDAMADAKAAVSGLVNTIGAQFAPVAVTVLDVFTNLTLEVGNFIDLAIAGFKQMMVGMQSMEGGFGLLINALGSVGAAFLSDGFAGAWEQAVGLMGAAWDTFTGSVIEVFSGMMNSIISIAESGVKMLIKPLVTAGAAMQGLGAMTVGLLTGKSPSEIKSQLRGISIAAEAGTNALTGRVTAVANAARSVASTLAAGGRSRGAAGGGALAALAAGGWGDLIEQFGAPLERRIGGRRAGAGGEAELATALRGGSGGATATFSAAAAAALGGRGVERDISDIRDRAKEQVDLLREAKRLWAKFGFG